MGATPPSNSFLGTDADGNLKYNSIFPVVDTVTYTSLTSTNQAVPIIIQGITYYLPVYNGIVNSNSVNLIPQTAVSVTSLTATPLAIPIVIGPLRYYLPLFI